VFPDLPARLELVGAGILLGTIITGDKYIGTVGGVTTAVALEAAARAWINNRETGKTVQTSCTKKT